MAAEKDYPIPKILNELLKKKGMTEATLVRKAGVASSTVNRLMGGATPDPRISTLEPLARCLDVTIDQLIGRMPLKDLLASFYPILEWDDVTNLKKLNLNDWPHWEATKLNVGSQAFGLIINSKTLIEPFSYNSLITIDPSAAVSDGDYIIIHQLDTNMVDLKRFIIDGNKQEWLYPLHSIMHQSIPIEKSELHKIIGVVIRVVKNIKDL